MLAVLTLRSASRRVSSPRLSAFTTFSNRLNNRPNSGSPLQTLVRCLSTVPSPRGEKGVATSTEATQPPPNFIIRNTPAHLLPYAYLARADKPIGTMLLLYPCLWSTTLAYHALPAASLLPSLPLLALFSTGAIVMRGAGCTINDMWDRDIDKQVERTKTRPLASGDLTMQQATGFLAAQLSVGLGVLLSLPHTAFCFKLGAASLPLVALYPTAKRWTRFPQLVLGLTFNWGAFMGWAATYGDVNLAACAPLYVSGIAWTMVYDTLYAWQDKKDDETIGMKSTAITFGENTKPILHAFTAVFGTGLAMTGMATDMSLPYYLGIAASTSHLVWQVHTADFDDVDNLSYRFRSNQVVGAGVLASVVAGNFFC